MTAVETATLYKVTGPDRTAAHGGSGQWPPVGEWTKPVRGKLSLCANGYHVVDLAHLRDWLRLTSEVYTVEPDTEIVHDGNKSCTRRARLTARLHWDRRVAVAWGVDCAERVLPLFEQRRPDDRRVRHCIETTRAWLRGEATLDQVHEARSTDAADAAAYAADAAADAADAAAYAADAAAYAAAADAADAYAAYAADAADAYAAYAADAAAYAAYAYAAYAADARSHEIEWQNERLRQYLYAEVAP